MSSDQDEPNGTPASALDADLTFDVVGTTLTLTVDNLSLYDITEVFFNTSDDIVSLSIDAPPTDADWMLSTGQSKSSFGTFDYLAEVQGDINASSATIMDGTSQALVFTLVCAGGATCDMGDFAALNAKGKAAGAKFQNGGEIYDEDYPGGNDSAFGASVPEPGTGALLGLGLLGLARLGRRHRG